MGLDITAFTLSGIVLIAVVVMLWIAIADLLEPNTVTQCTECHHLMIDSHHDSSVVCYRCRHDHHGHLAVGLARLHLSR